MTMEPIRMLVVDLDDTLLRSDLSISYHTRNVIKKAVSQGLVVVPASSRNPASLDQFSRILGMNKRPGYIICGNGTIILESNTRKIVWETQLNTETALAVYDLATAEGFPVQIYEDDIMYVSKTNEFTRYDQKLTGLKQVVADDFHAIVRKGCNKLLIPGDPMLLQPLESLIRTYLGKNINLFTSKPYFLEILPQDVDKGSALVRVAQMLGIEQGAVMAIGDSMNDETMIRWAGTGVAMLNGDERIKTIADLVTERSNEEDGVAGIIEQYILGKGSPL
ncbi:MAG: Cof-type HAD-IIB family hydrolase [Treponema sp.]|nr:Cof-type HAD-IIB family hydrolase [Treponema sp.]